MEKCCGYNILSVFAVLALTIVVDILLFISLHSKNKCRLYRLQGVLLAEILLFYVSRFIWRQLYQLCPQKSSMQKMWEVGLYVYFFMAQLGPFFTFYSTREPYVVGLLSWACCGSELLLYSALGAFELFYHFLRRLNCDNSGVLAFCQSKVKVGLCVLITLLYVSAAFQNATSAPIVVRQNIPIANLPSSMDGLKIALLADVHLGPTVGFSMMEKAVKTTNSIKPDIVVLAGDLTDGTVDELREAALPLKDIVAPYGSYFVTGNHEYYTSDVDNWMEFVKSMGFQVLHNSNVKVHSKKNPSDWICIFGTDDREGEIFRYKGHGVNLTKAFSGCDRDHAAILITHQPNVAKRALDMKLPIQLVLSGHTHGGQLFPLSIPVYLANAYFTGLYQYDADSYVYVTQGTYYYGWPLRMGSHNEISEIVLKSA